MSSYNRHSRSLDLKRMSRPSPSKSAAETPVGKVMKGNDGRMYIVVQRTNGKKWALFKGTEKKRRFGSGGVGTIYNKNKRSNKTSKKYRRPRIKRSRKTYSNRRGSSSKTRSRGRSRSRSSSSSRSSCIRSCSLKNKKRAKRAYK